MLCSNNLLERLVAEDNALGLTFSRLEIGNFKVSLILEDYDPLVLLVEDLEHDVLLSGHCNIHEEDPHFVELGQANAHDNGNNKRHYRQDLAGSS